MSAGFQTGFAPQARRGQRLRQLFDVSSRRPTDGQILVFNAASGKWEPRDQQLIPVSGIPQDGDILVYDAESGTWVPQPLPDQE